MALIASALDGAATVSFAMSGTTVTSVDLANSSDKTVTVDVARSNGSVVSKTLAAGETMSTTLPKGKQFTGTSEWSVSMTVG